MADDEPVFAALILMEFHLERLRMGISLPEEEIQFAAHFLQLCARGNGQRGTTGFWGATGKTLKGDQNVSVSGDVDEQPWGHQPELDG